MKILLILLAAAALGAYALPGESLFDRARRLVSGGKRVLGEVLAVDKVAYGRGRYYGVRLLLKTSKGKLPVYLGPSWFVNSQPMKVRPHDVIEVTGSRVTYDGMPTLIAAEVKKGGESLRIRTGEGLPLWRGSEGD